MNNFVAKIDCHLHTNFSGDGQENPEDMARACIKMGLEHICITDHMDLLYVDSTFKQFDMGEYLGCMRSLQEKYKNQIQINLGLEVGFTEENCALNADVLRKYDFDYVINSVHIINNGDCYNPSFFKGLSRDDAFIQYFDCVNKSLDAPYKMNALGHLGYISRYMPYENKQILPHEFDDILSTILNKVIARDMILELNTSSYGSGSSALPNETVLKKYRDIGGEQICFSSDAHTIKRIAANYESAAALALSLGYKNWTIIVNNKKRLIPI